MLPVDSKNKLDEKENLVGSKYANMPCFFDLISLPGSGHVSHSLSEFLPL